MVEPVNEQTTPMYCRQCLYNLHGLTAHRCPECGAPFDPDDPETFLASDRWVRPSLFLAGALVCVALCFFSAALIPRPPSFENYVPPIILWAFAHGFALAAVRRARGWPNRLTAMLLFFVLSGITAWLAVDMIRTVLQW